MISLIIPAYNSSKTIVATVNSVVAQDVDDLEIIVVDDGSSDNTKEVLAPFIDAGTIHYFYKDNGGVSSARNFGIANCRGEFICFLDADDELVRESISKRLAFLERYPETGLVFTDFLKKNTGNGTSSIHLREHHFLQDFAPAIEKKENEKYILGRIFFDCALKHNVNIWTGTVMIRRSVVDQVGLFDVGLKIAEDSDYWLRACAVASVGYIDEPLTVYYATQNSLTRNKELFYEQILQFWERLYRDHDLTSRQKYYLRRKIGNILFECGYHLAVNLQTKKSRERFLQSFLWWPFDFKLCKSILVSFLPGKVLQAVFHKKSA